MPSSPTIILQHLFVTWSQSLQTYFANLQVRRHKCCLKGRKGGKSVRGTKRSSGTLSEIRVFRNARSRWRDFRMITKTASRREYRCR
ncbi:hypothetical protein BJV77DRAFT_472893 [Russula vinacea]|nr:hypothetical protein BJV77DRAFT_472893 [Russula vinacea]